MKSAKLFQKTCEELLRLREESGRPFHEIEARLGLPQAGLWRRLNGEARLELQVVFDVLEELGEDPGAFFARIVPPAARPEERGLEPAELRAIRKIRSETGGEES
jgi:transcriptional regulator with XRE-family HTH domain